MTERDAVSQTGQGALKSAGRALSWPGCLSQGLENAGEWAAGRLTTSASTEALIWRERPSVQGDCHFQQQVSRQEGCLGTRDGLCLP